jgi:hypothetical protein
MWAGGAGGQPGALGEGTSDWYAMDLLVADGLETDSEQEQGDVRMGEYVDGDTTLIRHQGLDCRVGVTTGCPGPADTGPGGFDFSDYGRIEGAPDVHSDGEIWAETLWDVRRALTATRPDGVTRARRYITGGLRLAPPEPTFLEMRDAILQSAALAAGGEDVGTLWQAFAGRGLGWSATTDGPLDSQPSAAFDVPPGAHTGEATSVQATAATLNGVIDPNGEPTAYRFQFGETVTYGGATALGSLGGHDPIGVATTVTGLRPGTTYHYRVVALRGVRELDGADRTFTTPPPPPPAVPAAPAAPPAAIRPTSLVGSRLTVTAKGFFKVRAIFGDSAPLGSARITVLAGTRRLARASSPVRPGRTVTKTLRLSARGRDVIRRGRSKRVTVELRLPGGQKVKKTMRLTRRRR